MDLSGAERLYNPYEGLSTALDARAGLPRNLYRVPEQPEFLFSEEAGVHKRSWSENLTYYTGLGYLSGWCTAHGSVSQPTGQCLLLVRHSWHLRQDPFAQVLLSEAAKASSRQCAPGQRYRSTAPA